MRMNVATLIWVDAAMLVVLMLSHSAVGEGKRRHKNKNKSRVLPHSEDRDIDSDNSTILPENGSVVDSKWKHNGYKMWTIDKYPDPHKQPRKCGRPRQPSFLCDPDRILSTTQGQ